MSRSAPLYNEEQAKALRDALEARHPGDERPKKVIVAPPEASPPLDVAGNFVDELEKHPELNHNQRRIAYYLSKGWEPAEIAIRCACSAAYVRLLSHEPKIKHWVEVFKGGTIYEIAENISSQTVLNNAAIRAAEILAEKANFALDESNQIKAAIEILKLTNHYGNEGGNQVHITISRDQIDIYERAKTEAAQEADYTVED